MCTTRGAGALEGLSKLVRVCPASLEGVDRRGVHMDGAGVSACPRGVGGGGGLEASGLTERGMPRRCMNDVQKTAFFLLRVYIATHARDKNLIAPTGKSRITTKQRV